MSKTVKVAPYQDEKKEEEKKRDDDGNIIQEKKSELTVNDKQTEFIIKVIKISDGTYRAEPQSKEITMNTMNGGKRKAKTTKKKSKRSKRKSSKK
jgi:hypothetical protein